MELPMGPRDAVLGGQKCKIGCGGRMWAVPLGASVELLMGSRSAVLGGWKCQIGRGARMRAAPLGAS
eukprot:7122842-Pyramimonas_sp.AAC.1